MSSFVLLLHDSKLQSCHNNNKLNKKKNHKKENYTGIQRFIHTACVKYDNLYLFFLIMHPYTITTVTCAKSKVMLLIVYIHLRFFSDVSSPSP